MNNFKFLETGFEGLWLIETKVYGDERGFFIETYQKESFKELGLEAEFVQDNQSHSQRGILRGMHCQRNYPQAKLVRVVNGSIYDAVIDLRKDSNTFGKWYGVELSAVNKKMLYIPVGFAHGFLSLEDQTDFIYKCTDYYHPEDEVGVVWNDPQVKIKWPLDKISGPPILASRDKNFPLFKDIDFIFAR